MSKDMKEKKYDQVVQAGLPMKQPQIEKRSARLSQVVALLNLKKHEVCTGKQISLLYESQMIEGSWQLISFLERKSAELSELVTLGN